MCEEQIACSMAGPIHIHKGRWRNITCRNRTSHWSLELPWCPAAFPPLWEILLQRCCLPGFLVQGLIHWNTRLKLSARPHNGMITCVLCVRDLTERLYSTVKQSLGFWQGKKEINMCPGEEKNGSSWNVTQSFSKNVLSLGQQTFIKGLLCDRHCAPHSESWATWGTSFILDAYGEAHWKRRARKGCFQYHLASATMRFVAGDHGDTEEGHLAWPGVSEEA